MESGQYVELSFSNSSAPEGTPGTMKIKLENKDHWAERETELKAAKELLEHLEEGMKDFDHSPTMFGLQVNRGSVAYLFSVVGTLAVPYALNIASNIFSGSTK